MPRPIMNAALGLTQLRYLDGKSVKSRLELIWDLAPVSRQPF
jgi:hypothetical protein